MARLIRWHAGTASGFIVLALAIGSACSRDAQAISPQQLQQKYGISGAYAGQLSTPDGTCLVRSSR